jgi:hypothetical protein
MLLDLSRNTTADGRLFLCEDYYCSHAALRRGDYHCRNAALPFEGDYFSNTALSGKDHYCSNAVLWVEDYCCSNTTLSGEDYYYYYYCSHAALRGEDYYCSNVKCRGHPRPTEQKHGGEQVGPKTKNVRIPVTSLCFGLFCFFVPRWPRRGQKMLALLPPSFLNALF